MTLEEDIPLCKEIEALCKLEPKLRQYRGCTMKYRPTSKKWVMPSSVGVCMYINYPEPDLISNMIELLPGHFWHDKNGNGTNYEVYRYVHNHEPELISTGCYSLVKALSMAIRVMLNRKGRL